MPELPEVETIKRQLQRRIIGQPLRTITATWAKSLQASNSDLVAIKGSKISSIERRGKLLIINTDANLSLLIHLRMTGQLIVDRDKRLGPYERVTLELEEWTMHFNDQRKFGRLQIIASENVSTQPFLITLGPEATDTIATAVALRRHAPHRHTPIKALLLDQHVIAGIGNIYADEILFEAKVHPACPADQVSVMKLNAIARASAQVLSQAIELRGSTFRDYRDSQGQAGSYLSVARVHGRRQQSCRRCQSLIQYEQIAGRGTYWCLRCQVVPKSLRGKRPN